MKGYQLSYTKNRIKPTQWINIAPETNVDMHTYLQTHRLEHHESINPCPPCTHIPVNISVLNTVIVLFNISSTKKKLYPMKPDYINKVCKQLRTGDHEMVYTPTQPCYLQWRN